MRQLGAPRGEMLLQRRSALPPRGERDKRLPEIGHLQERVGTEHPKMDRGEEGAGGSAEAEQVPAPNPALKDEKLLLTFP